MLLEKFRGALLGVAVGDALGAPVEGFDGASARRFYEKHGWKMISGKYTDDTEMIIGVAESLIACKGFNGSHLAQQFLRNYNESRGYGPGTREVLKMLSKGVGWKEASRKIFGGEGSYGNGAAMRIAPVGLLYHENAEKLREVAFKVSEITHAHELAKEGAALLAFAVALACRYGCNRYTVSAEEEEKGARETKREMLRSLQVFARHRIYKEKLARIEALLHAKDNEEEARKRAVSELGNGEAAFNSVPTAIFSFLRSHDFRESIVFAISLGGDTDTIAAMTGAVSGAFYGERSIPRDWLKSLESGVVAYLTKLAEDLYELSKEI